VHPMVVRQEIDFLIEEERKGAKFAVLEIPLLFETGGEGRFDVVVVITAPGPVRAARSEKAQDDARSERLLPDEEKAARADFAYVNDGTLEQLDAFVGEVLDQLRHR